MYVYINYYYTRIFYDVRSVIPRAVIVIVVGADETCIFYGRSGVTFGWKYSLYFNLLVYSICTYLFFTNYTII